MKIPFFVEMVLMRLIKADKRLAECIKKNLNFSNYQMLCLSWAIGLAMSVAMAIVFLEISVAKDIAPEPANLTRLNDSAI